MCLCCSNDRRSSSRRVDDFVWFIVEFIVDVVIEFIVDIVIEFIVDVFRRAARARRRAMAIAVYAGYEWRSEYECVSVRERGGYA